jgi:hypothetical protein
MSFRSSHGNFTLQTPVTWKEITVQDSTSFDGEIVMGHLDTLHFSFGSWRSRLHYGQLSHAEDDEKSTPMKIFPARMDGCGAYRDISQRGLGARILATGVDQVQEGNVSEDWSASFYIDTVFMVGRDAMRFDLSAPHLSDDHTSLFYEVVKTIHFERNGIEPKN